VLHPSIWDGRHGRVVDRFALAWLHDSEPLSFGSNLLLLYDARMQPMPVTLRKLAASLLVSVVLAVLYLIFQMEKPLWFDLRVQTVFLAALAASAGYALLQLTSFLLLDVLFRRRKGREAPQIVRMVVAIIGYAAIFVVIYSGIFGRDVTSVLATSAVLSVILGLALQDTLGNFFAGISIHVEQPFYIGDALRVGDVLGRVESVTWRATSVRTNDNSIVILPNSRIARDAIEVYPLHALNRRILRIPAPDAISPETVIGLAREIAVSTPKVSGERRPEVRVAELKDSTIMYEILYWMEDYLWAREIEAVMLERVWYAFRRCGIELPFATHHVLIESRAAEAAQKPVSETDLVGVDILKPLGLEELKEAGRSAVRHLYAPGETVIHAGETGDSMFVIWRGTAEVLAADAGGSLRQLAVLGRKEVIGEMALFTGEPRRADVRALEELELLEIRRPVMQRLLSANTALAEAFSKIICARQLQLAHLAETRSGDVLAAAGDTILRRIRKFFNLA
jgi:small-conductance mechanosensitive channel/CRP-like cAMP-binding protein